MTAIRSRDNPQVRRWRRLVRDRRMRRREARALIEGPHLVEALLERGGLPVALLVSEDGLGRAAVAQLVARSGLSPVVLSEAVFAAISDTESPTGLAAEIAVPSTPSDLAMDRSAGRAIASWAVTPLSSSSATSCASRLTTA